MTRRLGVQSTLYTKRLELGRGTQECYDVYYIAHVIHQFNFFFRRMLGFDQKLRETKDTVMGEVRKRKMTIMMILMMMIIMIIVINLIIIIIL